MSKKAGAPHARTLARAVRAVQVDPTAGRTSFSPWGKNRTAKTFVGRFARESVLRNSPDALGTTIMHFSGSGSSGFMILFRGGDLITGMEADGGIRGRIYGEFYITDWNVYRKLWE